MKQSFLMALIFFAPIVFAHADDEATSERVMPIKQVYLPGDANDSAPTEIVIEGMLPDSCYSFARAEVKDDETFVHEVRSIATVRHDRFCLMDAQTNRVQNYSEHVNMGVLKAGVHKLLFIKEDGSYFERSLTVD
jgi:hypothetical protein